MATIHEALRGMEWNTVSKSTNVLLSSGGTTVLYSTVHGSKKEDNVPEMPERAGEQQLARETRLASVS